MAFVDVPMLMMCPPVRAAHHTSQVQILASVPGSPGVPDPPLARGQPPPHRCPHDRSISAWYSHPPIMHQALPRCRRCRPPLPRPYLFRTSAFPVLSPSLDPSLSGLPRWSVTRCRRCSWHALAPGQSAAGRPFRLHSAWLAEATNAASVTTSDCMRIPNPFIAQRSIICVPIMMLVLSGPPCVCFTPPPMLASPALPRATTARGHPPDTRASVVHRDAASTSTWCAMHACIGARKRRNRPVQTAGAATFSVSSLAFAPPLRAAAGRWTCTLLPPEACQLR